VNFGVRDVIPRSFPTFKGWTSEIISSREFLEMSTGGFGQGHIDPQLDEMKIGENLGSTSQVVQEVVGLKDIQVSHVLVKSILNYLA